MATKRKHQPRHTNLAVDGRPSKIRVEVTEADIDADRPKICEHTFTWSAVARVAIVNEA